MKPLPMSLACSAILLFAVPASAATQIFNLSGSGVTGSVTITYDVNSNTGVLPQTSPNPVDPIGSYVVTDVSGMLSDSNIGLVNAAITGVIARNFANPEPDNLLAPNSFSHFSVTNGVDHGGGIVSPFLSFDDLYYPGGSPQSASDYPFHGGFFDIYGLMFSLSNGNSVNLWSNGDFGAGPSYGVAITDGTDLLDYAQPVSLSAVPEPKSWLLMVLSFGVLGAVMRARRITSSITRRSLFAA